MYAQFVYNASEYIMNHAPVFYSGEGSQRFELGLNPADCADRISGA